MKFWDEEFYSRKLIIKYLWVFVLISFAMKFTSGIAFAVIIPIALVALFRRDALLLFYVILLSTTSLVANGWLVPKGLVYAILQRGVMVLVGCITLLQVFGQRQSRYLKPLLGLTFYLVYILIVSQTGYSPIISSLKWFLFTITFFAYYSCATSVANSRGFEVYKLRSMMLAIAIFFIVGSLLVLPFPSIGMMNPESAEEMITLVSLFKGMTNHSQELGPVVTFLGLFLAADWIFTLQKRNALYLVLLLIVPFLIYKTSSRTAMGAFIVGLFFLYHCVSISREVKRSWKGVVISAFLAITTLGVVFALVFPSVRQGASKFIIKYRESPDEIRAEEVFSTREGKWNEALYGWRQSPYLGNGFQVVESMEGFKSSDIKDYLTAPVEKSTWIYAILEEGGVFGMSIFVIFIITTYMAMMRRKAYIGAVLFITMLTLNLGEFTIFAMSGSGGFMWAILMTGLVFDEARNKSRQRQWGYAPPQYFYGY